MSRKLNIVRLQSVLAAVIGLLLILRPLVRLAVHYFGLLPLTKVTSASVDAGMLSTVFGLLLVYTSFYLAQRKRSAYTASLVVAIATLVVVLAERHTPPLAVALLVCFIVWMIFSGSFYNVRSDGVRLAYGLRAALLVALLGLLYGFAGFMVLGPKEFHQSFGIVDAAAASFRTMFTLSDAVTAPNKPASVFLDSLGIIGFVAYFIGAASLFKPVRFALGSGGDTLKAARILEKTSTSSEDFFKLWPKDKHYFFSRTGTSFIAYKLSGRTAIILAEPSGEPNEFTQLLAEFKDFVHSNGWMVAAVNVSTDYGFLYEEVKMNPLFVGNEAIVDTEQFTEHTLRSKHFRYVMNKAKKENLSTEMWESPNHAQLVQLKRVSDDWLRRGGRKEFTFFMGYFNEDYLRQCRIMVLKSGHDIIGYVNLIPSYVPHTESIDQFRAMSSAPAVAMHFLLSQLLVYLRDHGTKTLNIGLAPLAQPSENTSAMVNERLLNLFKRLAGQYYSFSGVEQFKSKFQPQWQPRYVYYEKSTAALMSAARDIEAASRLSHDISRRVRLAAAAVGTVVVLVGIQFL